MIRQIFAEMSDTELAKSAFIQITAKDSLADVNRDLKALESQGFRYVFLDEVTLMEDFIEGAALFSDVFAACGMKIVLSGTDSLGFLFTEDEQLYDRCILLHTTFIPYREFESVLGIHGIDEYIRYGGTMSLGGVHYNETSTFASKESTDEYVDTAIARNIQHSLRCYQYEGHFRHLRDLYDKNELTSAINRVWRTSTTASRWRCCRRIGSPTTSAFPPATCAGIGRTRRTSSTASTLRLSPTVCGSCWRSATGQSRPWRWTMFTRRRSRSIWTCWT